MLCATINNSTLKICQAVSYYGTLVVPITNRDRFAVPLSLNIIEYNVVVIFL